jgi:hypothetical protein
MDKAERAQLLRARLKALGGYRSVPKREPKRAYVRRHYRCSVCVRVEQHVRELPLAWISVPVAQPDPLALQPRRIARKSPLWAIAAKWQERPRIPKRYLASRR